MKALIVSTIALIILISSSAKPQTESSINILGGIISPINSSNGLTGLLEFNRPVSNKISLYTYSGLLSWDKNSIRFHIPNRNDVHSYSETDHILIPFYFSAKFSSEP